MSHYLPRQETFYGGANGSGVELKALTLDYDKDFGYYLSAKYRVEDEHSIREIDIPRIMLGVKPNFVAIRQDGDPWIRSEADIGFGYCLLGSVDFGNGINTNFIEHVLKEKTHEMTLDEIEKKLGYKVKIVNK